jgi:hypothetical protein
MQPYIFPYIGYYQLAAMVDEFVFYDDVNFIQRGWINRNNILIGGNANMFTIPLENPSQNSLINEVAIKRELYGPWKDKFMKTVQHAYSKAPFYNNIIELVDDTLNINLFSISDLAIMSIKNPMTYLKLPFQNSLSSERYSNNVLRAQDRILDICNIAKATEYINPIGGVELYDKTVFKEHGIKLSFIKTKFVEYKQFKGSFVKGLSIIDVLMFNDQDEVKQMLMNFELV